MQARVWKTLVLVMLLAAPSSVANAAVVRRPMVGFLPFQGPRGASGYAISQVVFWESCHIPNTSAVDLRVLGSCIELDKLPVPRSLNDRAGYSRLASSTGVDYLVSGIVEHQDASRVRFRVIVYSAADPRFHSERSYACDLSSLVVDAVGAAKHIASAAGVPAASKIKFDTERISPQALRLLDRSVRLIAGCERDAADGRRSSRFADRAEALCPKSPMVSEWALSWFSYTSKGLDGYVKLYKRDPGNPAILSSIVWQCFDLGQRERARHYASKWLKLDPTSLSAQIVVNGKATSQPTHGWQKDLSIATTYSVIGDLRRLEPSIKALELRCPNSAYIRYRAGYLSASASQWGSAACDYEDAARLNPDSFRLQMKLINGYLNVWRQDQALTAAMRALKRWPKRSECHAVAAKVYRETKEYGKASAEMRTALKLDADASVDRGFLAAQDLRSGRFAEGLSALASNDPSAKHAMALLSVILIGLFLIVVAGIAVLVRVMLRPDRKPGP